MQTGSLVLPDGYYEGEIKDNKPHGYGFKKYKDGILDGGYFFNGELKLGRRNQIITRGKKLLEALYQGQFKDNWPHGYGREDYSNCTMFRGQFVKGKPYKGVMFERNGKEKVMKAK